jgi:hypothetical protein
MSPRWCFFDVASFAPFATRSVSEGSSNDVDLTMQKGPSLTLRVVKNQAKRRPERFKATNSATSKLTLRVTKNPRRFTNRLFQHPAGELRVDPIMSVSTITTGLRESWMGAMNAILLLWVARIVLMTKAWIDVRHYWRALVSRTAGHERTCARQDGPVA